MKYNANSLDAVVATIMARLKQQDDESKEYRDMIKGLLDEIKIEVKKTNGRVTSLEAWRTFIKGKVVMISAIVSAIGGFLAWWIPYAYGK